MRFRHLLESNRGGTFVGVRLTSDSNARLSGWLSQNLIKDPQPPDELHVTLIFDKDKKFTHDPIRYIPPVPIDPNTYNIDLFGINNDIMVLRFDCDFLQKRHTKLRKKYDIDWKFPTFEPHITLTSTVQEIATDLNPPDFELELDREYVEEFYDEDD